MTRPIKVNIERLLFKSAWGDFLILMLYSFLFNFPFNYFVVQM